VIKIGRITVAEQNNAGEALFERYLVEVFQYISCWTADASTAEDLTLKILRSEFSTLKKRSPDQESLSIRIFTLARDLLLENFGELNSETAKCGSPWSKYGLAGLSDLEKEVIALKFCSQLNNRSLGHVLGLPESTVETQLLQAIRKLDGRLLSGQR
jgi:hypothetical protein